MDVHAHNQAAWDQLVDLKNRWTIPVTSEEIERARQGDWSVVLTPTKPVPRDWFPELDGCRVLCLASSGGQQGPLLSAAGAKVTVLDASSRQLEQDRFVAQRDNLDLETIQGDMSDLSVFADNEFELIFHPCSNCFVPDVTRVWRECFRVLKKGGSLLAGFTNPLRYLFEEDPNPHKTLIVRYSILFSDLTSLTEQDRCKLVRKKQVLVFGHTLEDQIGGQTDAGFAITGFYEDGYPNGDQDTISKYIKSFIATRAVKQV